jgi:hypothetical protein
MGTTVVLSRSLPGVGAPPTVRLASWEYSLPVSVLSRIRLNTDYAEVDVKPEILRMAC